MAQARPAPAATIQRTRSTRAAIPLRGSGRGTCETLYCMTFHTPARTCYEKERDRRAFSRSAALQEQESLQQLWQRSHMARPDLSGQRVGVALDAGVGEKLAYALDIAGKERKHIRIVIGINSLRKVDQGDFPLP